jgi:phosphomannomutase
MSTVSAPILSQQTISEPILSISGLRGIVGQQLRPEDVSRYVMTACSVWGKGPIVLSRDSRRSGAIFRHAVLAALTACGREVIEIGIAPTPTVGIVIRRLGAAGGVQISGSHNPPEENGIKLLDQQGKMLPPDAAKIVRERYFAGFHGYPQRVLSSGNCTYFAMAALWHLRAVEEVVAKDQIQQRKFRVVLDSNGGAGGPLGIRLLESLGCQVIGVGTLPDGNFRHPPEPLPENLAEVASFVAQCRADLGFCQDPDADRLVIIDSSGQCLSEEHTLSICLDHVLQSRKGPVVINCATSMMNEWIAARHGVECIRVPVGEANVVAGMLHHHAVFGGEGNGGPIDPRIGWIRDSFLGMALVLEAMAIHGVSVRELTTRFPPCVMKKLKLPLPPGSLERVFTHLTATFPTAQVDKSDGLRLSWSDRWLLCRPSNTEPILRIIAEARSPEVLEELCQQAQAAAQQALAGRES